MNNKKAIAEEQFKKEMEELEKERMVSEKSSRRGCILGILIPVIIMGGLLLWQYGEGVDLSLPASPTDCDYLVIQMAEKRIVNSYDYKHGELKRKLIAVGIQIEYSDTNPRIQSNLPAEQAIYKANYYRRMFNWNEAPPLNDVLEDYGKVPDYAKECYEY